MYCRTDERYRSSMAIDKKDLALASILLGTLYTVSIIDLDLDWSPISWSGVQKFAVTFLVTGTAVYIGLVILATISCRIRLIRLRKCRRMGLARPKYSKRLSSFIYAFGLSTSWLLVPWFRSEVVLSKTALLVGFPFMFVLSYGGWYAILVMTERRKRNRR